MKVKVGIVTFHIAASYGAQLQCYATSTLLTAAGHNVQVIDYIPPYFAKQYLPQCRFSGNGWKLKLLRLRYILQMRRKYERKFASFQAFREKNLCLSQQVSDAQPLRDQFDAIICGSDQIWNPAITHGYDSVYFGEGFGEKTRIVAYAASCGNVSAVKNTAPERFLSLLETVDDISCREQPLADYISAQTLRKTPVVADPTLLVSRALFLQLATPPKHRPENYILLYQLAQNKVMTAAAKRLAKQSGKRIVTLFGNLSFTDCGKHGIHAASVEEFLWLLANADVVLTNSFHGVSLSIVLQKPFFAFEAQTQNERLRNLLQRADLESRLCENGCITDEAICYDEVQRRLQPWLAESKQFIYHALSGAEWGRTIE